MGPGGGGGWGVRGVRALKRWQTELGNYLYVKEYKKNLKGMYNFSI